MLLSRKRQEAGDAKESLGEKKRLAPPGPHHKTFVCGGSTHVGAGNTEEIWSEDVDKGSHQTDQLEPCWLVWWEDHMTPAQVGPPSREEPRQRKE